MGALDASSVVFFTFRVINKVFSVSRSKLFLPYTAIPIAIIATVWIWPKKAHLSYSEKQPEEEPLLLNHDSLFGKQWIGVPFKHQFVSGTFLVGILFLSLHLFRINWYIGTLPPQMLTFPGIEHATAELYLDIFALMLPLGGVLSAPVIGAVIDKKGIVFSLVLINTVGLFYGIISLVPILPVQLVTFLLLCVFRPCMYAAMSAFVAVYFGFANFGKLYGSMLSISSAVNLMQYVLIRFVYSLFDGKFIYIDGTLTIVSAMLYMCPLFMYVRVKASQPYVPRSLIVSS